MKEKTLNDFLWWLEVSGLLQLYFSHVKEVCNEHRLLMSDHIKHMDANNINTLFGILSTCAFWDEPIGKYMNWLKDY